jgi:DNA invertase Pin-like site-specific DNA recombinase
MAEQNKFFGNKALLLSRISTPEQELKEGFSPQQNDLRIFAKEQGYTDLVPIDTIESGFLDLDTKEGWNAIIDYLEHDKDCRTIIATEINRIARDQSVLQEVKKYLIKNQIQLIIKDLHFWLLNPDGTKTFSADLLFAIYSSMAEWEMLDKKERQQRALREYRKEGYSIGGKVLFGYVRKYDPKFKNKSYYIINEEQQEQIVKVYQWYAYGINNDLSITSLKRLRLECVQAGFDKYLHSQRNLNKCLKEQAYIGKKETHNMMKNPEYWNYHDKSAPRYIEANSYECVYPQLIDKDLFFKVQERLSKQDPRKRAVSNNKYVDISGKHITLLSKIVVCPICGGFLTGDYRIKDGFNKHTYRCAKSRRNIEDCSFRKAPSMLSLDSAVWSFLKTKVTEINAKRNSQYTAIKQEDVYNRIKNLEEELKLIEDDYDDAEYIYNQNKRRNRVNAREKYQAKLNEIDKRKADIEKQIYKNKRLLEELKGRDTTEQREKELESNILKISNTKEEIYKYMHLLIKTVKPLLLTNRYAVLEVITFDNTDDVFDYGKEDSQGLPVIKGEKHDNMYFICLDKRDNHRVKARLINHTQAFWDVEGEFFYVVGDERHYSIEDIFNVPSKDIDPPPYFHVLYQGLEELDYQPLRVYDEDKVKTEIETVAETSIV